MKLCVDHEWISRWVPIVLGSLGLGLGVPCRAPAQSPAAPPPSVPAAPALPANSGARTAYEAALEERLRQMEDVLKRMPDPEHVRQLESTVERLSTQVDRLSTRLRQAEARRPTSMNGTRAGPGMGSAAGTSGVPAGVVNDAGPGGTASETEEFGAAAGFSQVAESPSPRFDMPFVTPNAPTQSRWGPGFQLRTTDDEFDIQFHNLTQLDGRFYGIPNQTPVSDTFGIARQWFVFNGHLTRPYEYYVSFNDSFDSFAALDVFLNVNYDKRLQFRFGRFKSPFCYEFYAQPTEALASGEWSVFFNNFGINRDLGTMLWGESVAGRIDYAAGIFNSVPNAQFDLSNPKSVIAFLNLAPFRPVEDSPLENFNVGGSLVAGNQNHVPVPQELRTIVPVTGSNVIGVPFLTFNNNVVVSGPRNLWSLHSAYFYRSLMVLAEWQSGFQDYALANNTNSRVHLPIESFYVQASYFLTGERLASRGRVKPLRSFDLRPGRFGLGAWEVVARYSHLTLGQQVFTAGLADPNNWTNSLFVTDLGINWYWNPYIHVLFDWQHAGFGSPVVYAPGGFARTSDLFMIRFEVWF
jgi:phosphate-selective porin OprO/OprP